MEAGAIPVRHPGVHSIEPHTHANSTRVETRWPRALRKDIPSTKTRGSITRTPHFSVPARWRPYTHLSAKDSRLELDHPRGFPTRARTFFVLVAEQRGTGFLNRSTQVRVLPRTRDGDRRVMVTGQASKTWREGSIPSRSAQPPLVPHAHER